MDRLDQLSKYFKEKERKKLNEKAKDNEKTLGLPEMTADEIRLSCIENNGYETPELNEKLYLHFRGFKKIENLDAYTSCKAIWLDSNGFEVIEGLGSMRELRCLYLSKNLVSKVQGLENLSNLVLLDLSNNRLTKVEGLDHCPHLQTLNVSRNALSGVDSIQHLQCAEELINLDLSNNRLEADEVIVDTIKSFPALSNLSINGNDITKLASFRKRMISSMPKLCYLDRPVDELERIAATAFVAGGIDAETQARNDFRQSKEQQRLKEAEDYRAWQREQAQKRVQARAEGRSYITEMTPEEVTERQREAKLAAENEKFLLEEGIGKLAAKYWQLESSVGNSRVDVLEEATQELLRERELRLLRAEAVETDEIVVELPSIDAPEPDVILASEQQEVSVFTPDPRIVEQTPVVDLMEVEAKKMEEHRRDLVAESFAIYKKEIAEEAEGKASSKQPLSTWSLETKVKDIDQLYWSETMDIELAKATRKFTFDFDEISQELINLAGSGMFGFVTKQISHLINAEECRLRWVQLDAENWAEIDPESYGEDVLYKVCIPTNVLGGGHGAQPSFNALRALTSGSKPTYLTPPSTFPSVVDAESDEDDENLVPYDIRGNNKNFDVILEGTFNPRNQFEILD